MLELLIKKKRIIFLYQYSFYVRDQLILGQLIVFLTHHMTHEENLFNELNPTENSNVWIGNVEHFSVKGIRTIAVKMSSVTKKISEVLYTLEID